METAQLIQGAVFLAAAAIAAPLGRSLRMGAVLGYLATGVVIGPYVLGPLYALDDVGELLHFGEFGVVMLLFVIGLELRPVRLWALRSAIFGLGTAQLVATSAVLALIGIMLGLGVAQALFVGLALSLSSTAFALQVLGTVGWVAILVTVVLVGGLLSIILAITLVAFNFKPLFGGGNTYEAEFKEAAGLQAEDQVTVAGVEVGRVQSVELERDHVLVTFKIGRAHV